jgi:glycosyltransferase involved in cell wall biosynthesis
MKVCMFVLNNCKYDARVLREAQTLSEAGHDVRIIAVLDKDTEPYEEKDGFRIIRVRQRQIPHQVPEAVAKAELFAADFAFQLARRAYHLAGRGPEQPSHPSGQSGQSAQDKAAQRQARSGTQRLMEVAFSKVEKVVPGARRRLHSVARTALWILNAPLTLGNYYRFWKAAKREPANVYHCHDLPTLPLGYIAKRRIGGKLVYDSHELFTELHYVPRVNRPIFGFLERHLIRRADVVITVNRLIAEELSQRYGINLPDVVMNCPPLARHTDIQGSRSLRVSLGLDATVPIIVHVGKFDKARGAGELILATPFLDCGVVVFLGWSEEEAQLKELVRRRHLRDRVLFAPPVAPDQVVGHISSADVGVIPVLNVSLNHYYATPNKLWECLSAGLPVVSSNFPALRAVVEGHSLGCTCDTEYVRDIANAINYVLSDQTRYEEMRRNALEAAKTFNWENESAKLLHIYGRLS